MNHVRYTPVILLLLLLPPADDTCTRGVRENRSSCTSRLCCAPAAAPTTQGWGDKDCCSNLPTWRLRRQLQGHSPLITVHQRLLIPCFTGLRRTGNPIWKETEKCGSHITNVNICYNNLRNTFARRAIVRDWSHTMLFSALHSASAYGPQAWACACVHPHWPQREALHAGTVCSQEQFPNLDQNTFSGCKSTFVL